MNIFETIENIKCSTTEQQIREAILKDSSHFISLSISEISKEYAISRATIYRFLDKLGLNGLADLKVKIIQDKEEWESSKLTFDYNYPVTDGASIQRIAENLETDYYQTVLSTKSLLNFHSLRTSANLLSLAKDIDIYTSAGNIYFADNFRFQMKEIGKNVNVPHELYEQMLFASSSDEKHFAIIISFGGRNWQIEKVCKILKNNGTKILLICSNQAEKLFPYSSLRLYLPTNENHADKISSFSTRISILYILDMLYTCYFEKEYEENVQRKSQYYKKLSK